MTESNTKPEKPNACRFSQEQYNMLKCCSDKKDMNEWNEWRRENDDIDIKLEGADFSRWYLQEVNLGTLPEHGSRTTEVFLSKANFDNANLRRANFQFAHVEGARFHEAHVEDAELMFAHLDNAFLLRVHLEGAGLRCAELPCANVCNAHLNRSDFVDSHLEGSKFNNACLIGAKFQMAHVSQSTSFCYCEVGRETDFREVAIGGVQIDSATKQLLEYNIRRKNWEDWYQKGRLWQRILKRIFVWPFWLISDYGISTQGIIRTFFKWAFVFAIVYYAWGCIDYYIFSNKDYPGIVSNLFVLEDSKQAVSGWLVPLRAIYFSIVTMTTLGFGDMYANAHSLFRGIFGHILLAFQVILGYVLLGALVTRFAVLFTAGGPAGKFADEKEKEDKKK